MIDAKLTQSDRLPQYLTQDMFGNGKMDISYDNVGVIITVQGIDLLNQEVQKMLLTKEDTNHLYPAWGCSLRIVQGMRNHPELVKSFVMFAVNSAIEVFKELQTEQARKVSLTAEELLDSVKGISVQQDETDKTKSSVFLSIRTLSGTSFVTQVALGGGGG